MGMIQCCTQDFQQKKTKAIMKRKTIEQVLSIIYQGTKINILEGQVEQDSSDGILIIQDSYFAFSHEQSRFVKNAAGESVIDEINTYIKSSGFLKSGSFLKTHSGDLQQDFIYHTCLPEHRDSTSDYQQKLYNLLYKILKDGFQTTKLRSFAMPILTMSTCEFERQMAAKIMFNCIKKFIQKHQTLDIEEINIINRTHKSNEFLENVLEDVFEVQLGQKRPSNIQKSKFRSMAPCNSNKTTQIDFDLASPQSTSFNQKRYQFSRSFSSDFSIDMVKKSF